MSLYAQQQPHSATWWPLRIDFDVYRQYVRGYTAFECAETLAIDLAAASIDHEQFECRNAKKRAHRERERECERQRQRQQGNAGGKHEGDDDDDDDELSQAIPTLVDVVNCARRQMRREKRRKQLEEEEAEEERAEEERRKRQQADESPLWLSQQAQQEQQQQQQQQNQHKSKKRGGMGASSISAAIMGSLVQASEACRGYLLEEVAEQYLLFRQLEAATDDFLNDPRSFLDANVDSKSAADRRRILEEYYVLDPVFYRCCYGVRVVSTPPAKFAAQVIENIARTPAPVMLLTAEASMMGVCGGGAASSSSSAAANVGGRASMVMQQQSSSSALARGSNSRSAIATRGAAANGFILRQSQNLHRIASLLAAGYGPGGTFSPQFFSCVDAIAENFQLPSPLAWLYATLVFAAHHRLRDAVGVVTHSTTTTTTSRPLVAPTATASAPSNLSFAGSAAASPQHTAASSTATAVAAAAAVPSPQQTHPHPHQHYHLQQRSNQLISFLVVPVDAMQGLTMLLMHSLCTDSKLFVDERLQEDAGVIAKLLADARIAAEIAKAMLSAAGSSAANNNIRSGMSANTSAANAAAASSTGGATASQQQQQQQQQQQPPHGSSVTAAAAAAASAPSPAPQTAVALSVVAERVLRAVARACHAFSGGGHMPTMQLGSKSVVLGFCLELEQLFLASTTMSPHSYAAVEEAQHQPQHQHQHQIGFGAAAAPPPLAGAPAAAVASSGSGAGATPLAASFSSSSHTTATTAPAAVMPAPQPQPTTTTMHIQHQNILSGMGHEQILAAPSVLQETRRQLIALKRALAAPSVTSVSATATMMSSVVGGITQGSLVGGVVGAGQRPSFGNARTAEAAARILDLAIAMSAMFHATVI